MGSCVSFGTHLPSEKSKRGKYMIRNKLQKLIFIGIDCSYI